MSHGDLEARLDRLREERIAEDDRLVCMERARILQASLERHRGISHTQRQAAVLHDLCAGITPVVGPDDLTVGCMPQVVPSHEEERFIAEHPELFVQPGVPGQLDSMSIYVPDWHWLVEVGLGGIKREAEQRVHTLAGASGTDDRRRFLQAVQDAAQAMSLLIQRYADACRALAAQADTRERQGELVAAADRCGRVAWGPAGSFADALQLMQLVHMALSCLVGGRDVTPGRLDQYLFGLYEADVHHGRLTRGEGAGLLAMFLLRLSQMSGSGTDFDDDVRRTPCRYTHLYLTVGGTGADGRSSVNSLSYVVLDAIRLLRYKEPTLMVRDHPSHEAQFMEEVAGLVQDRLPVTIYNDEAVVPGLVRQDVPLEWARGYAHSACHNVLVACHEAGSGPGGFCNVPNLLLLAMNGGRDLSSGQIVGAQTPSPEDIGSLDDLLASLREQMRLALGKARATFEQRWRETYGPACPLLASALMRRCLTAQEPAWRAAEVSHFNYHFMGVATTVDSLVAVEQLVFKAERLTLADLLQVLLDDWQGNEALRQEVQHRLARYGQDNPHVHALTRQVGDMWVATVEEVAGDMARLRLWPGFYSHLWHIRTGESMVATPDGRRKGERLSENLGPSIGTTGLSPTSLLRSMAALPLDHTASGAATLALSPSDVAGPDGARRLAALLRSYFDMGGLHLQLNLVGRDTLLDALEHPEQHAELMVRVTGFSAYFTRLNGNVQQDLLSRFLG